MYLQDFLVKLFEPKLDLGFLPNENLVKKIIFRRIRVGFE